MGNAYDLTEFAYSWQNFAYDWGAIPTAIPVFDGKIRIKNEAVDLVDGKAAVIGPSAVNFLDGKIKVDVPSTGSFDGTLYIMSIPTLLVDGKLVVKDISSIQFDGFLSLILTASASGWLKNKGLGPWAFTEQEDKYGYLNNPRWSSQRNAQTFIETSGMPSGMTGRHTPCGHWHKTKGTPPPAEPICTDDFCVKVNSVLYGVTHGAIPMTEGNGISIYIYNSAHVLVAAAWSRPYEGASGWSYENGIYYYSQTIVSFSYNPDSGWWNISLFTDAEEDLNGYWISVEAFEDDELDTQYPDEWDPAEFYDPTNLVPISECYEIDLNYFKTWYEYDVEHVSELSDVAFYNNHWLNGFELPFDGANSARDASFNLFVTNTTIWAKAKKIMNVASSVPYVVTTGYKYDGAIEWVAYAETLYGAYLPAVPDPSWECNPTSSLLTQTYNPTSWPQHYQYEAGKVPVSFLFDGGSDFETFEIVYDEDMHTDRLFVSSKEPGTTSHYIEFSSPSVEEVNFYEAFVAYYPSMAITLYPDPPCSPPYNTWDMIYAKIDNACLHISAEIDYS